MTAICESPTEMWSIAREHVRRGRGTTQSSPSGQTCPLLLAASRVNLPQGHQIKTLSDALCPLSVFVALRFGAPSGLTPCNNLARFIEVRQELVRKVAS
jgi:hypothetical protein